MPTSKFNDGTLIERTQLETLRSQHLLYFIKAHLEPNDRETVYHELDAYILWSIYSIDLFRQSSTLHAVHLSNLNIYSQFSQFKYSRDDVDACAIYAAHTSHFTIETFYPKPAECDNEIHSWN